jgi:hypothetical protein
MSVLAWTSIVTGVVAAAMTVYFWSQIAGADRFGPVLKIGALIHDLQPALTGVALGFGLLFLLDISPHAAAARNGHFGGED